MLKPASSPGEPTAQDDVPGFRWLLAAAILTNLSGLFLPLMEPDAALYAEIARNMAESGDFVHLFAKGTDWLDKPHLPFWLTAISFRAFGVNEVSYRLPGVLIFGLGVLYTWLYAARLYSTRVAAIAVLILLTAQHIVVSNTDVRAEPFLLGFLIAAVYHAVRANASEHAWHIVPAALFTACAMMTKGPFALIPVAAALLVHWVARGEWRLRLAQPRWYGALLLTFVFTLPELYALYVQFDLHPAKVVFGQTNVSGVRFFFWDSQFGRFLSTGPIRFKGDSFFYLHTLLWAFLPWSLLLYGALFSAVRRIRSARSWPELYSFGAAVPMLVIFSFSRFQLPHYTNILFPFFAVITAHWLHTLDSVRARRWAAGALTFTAVIFFIVGAGVLTTVRPPGFIPVLVAFAVAIAFVVVLFRGFDVGPSFARTLLVACAFNLTVHLAVFPELLRYQSGIEAAARVNALPPRQTAMYVLNSFAFDFYTDRPVARWSLEELKEAASREPVTLYFPEDRLAELNDAGLDIRPIAALSHFHVARLRPGFLSASTREAVLERRVLAEVRGRTAAGGR